MALLTVLEWLEMNISEMQSQLKDELTLLTEAQSKLDEAMETVAPLQQQVNASRRKLKTLSVEIPKKLGVIKRRGRGWVLVLPRSNTTYQET